MFNGSSWAGVFVDALGENAEAALACMRTIAPQIKVIHCAMSGNTTALRVEKILRKSEGSFTQSGETAGGIPLEAAEMTIRFISLLIRKNRFKHIDSIMQKIEEQIYLKNGTLAVTAEYAAPMEHNFEEELRRQIAERTGAKKVILKTNHAPELLGGFRLHMGGFYIDASLKGQLEKMKAALETAAINYCTGQAPVQGYEG